MTHAYLGLGSDQGDRAAWLLRGLHELADAGVRISKVSSIYLTEPVGDLDLPWFLNCVVEVADPPEPQRLLEVCLQVEQRCGRTRRFWEQPQSGTRSVGGGLLAGRGGSVMGLVTPPRVQMQGASTPAMPTRIVKEARTLDIDVLLYDQLVVDGRGLAIPHPRMHERRFVLQPLVEITPTAPHPLLGQNVGELLAQLQANERVWLLAPPPAQITGR